MKFSIRIKPISQLTANASEIARNLAEVSGGLVIAQYGEAKAAIARRSNLMSEVQRRLKQFERTRVAFRAEDVHRYFAALANGKQSARPKPVK